MKNKNIFLFFLLLVLGMGRCGGDGSEGSEALFTIGGTVTGLSDDTVVLQNNGGDDLTITTDGSFTFETALTDGSVYEVLVSDQPSFSTCTVLNGSGTLSGSDVSDVSVTCSGPCGEEGCR